MTNPFTRTTPIWIYSKDEELRLILDPNGAIPHFDSWYTEQLNGAITLEFAVPANGPRVEEIENDGRAVTRDQDGYLVEFIIREPEDTNDANGPVKRVFAEGGDYELIDEWMTGYKADNVTLKTALEAVLSNTRVTVGVVDDFGTQSVDIKPTTVKNAVYQLIEMYGGERRYRVDVDGNRITARYIDVLKRRGEFSGKRFEHGKDIESIRHTPDSTGIKTALYGYGASGANDGPRLTFANVAWSKANGDPADKPLGQTWVGDADALQRWGYDKGTRHRFGEYSGQEEDPAELLLNTWNHLQTVNDVVRTYEIKVALLEKVRLGDTVLAIDREIHPTIEIEADVIEYRQNLNDDQLDEVIIGSFRNVFDATVKVRSAEQVIASSRGNWDKKETPEAAQLKANTAEKNAKDYTDDTAVQKGITYTNGWLWDETLGAIVSRSDGLVRTVQSGTDGFKIQVRETTADTWQDVFYVDAGKKLKFIGDIEGGSIKSNTTIDVTTDANIGRKLSIKYDPANPSTVDFLDELGNVLGSLYKHPTIDGLTVRGKNLELTCDQNQKVFLGYEQETYYNSAPAGDWNVGWYTKRGEEGVCGIGTTIDTSKTGLVIGTQVQFKMKKDIGYNLDPSYITLVQSSAVLSNSEGLKTADLSRDGFWLYIENQTAGTRYWRGKYRV